MVKRTFNLTECNNKSILDIHMMYICSTTKQSGVIIQDHKFKIVRTCSPHEADALNQN
jgi:hypothetical protein